MGNNLHLGELEELILLAVAALTETAYGFTVRELLDEKAGRSVTLATVHSALYRLERKGMLRSHLGGATSERGGRNKRLFTITSSGRQAVHARQAARESLRAMIPSPSLS